MKGFKGERAPKIDDVEGYMDNVLNSSDDEYSEEEKELLSNVRTRKTSENFDSDEEVYGLQNEEDDDAGDSMESDIEGLNEDDDLPNDKAWGKKKRAYFATDYVDQDYASKSQKELENAELEEKEARKIQKRLAEQLEDADFGFDLIPTAKQPGKEEESVEVVKLDISKLSKREKLALFEKESPEFSVITNDFREKMSEAENILRPFLEYAKTSFFKDCEAVSFLKMKYELILNYCTNVLFYLLLKSKRISIRHHPVMKRLTQYRQLLSQFIEKQGDLVSQASEFLNALKDNKDLSFVNNDMEIKSKSEEHLTTIPEELAGKKRKRIDDNESDEELDQSENEIGSDEDEEEMDIEELKEEHVQEEEMDPNAKRAITYQIQKNKGLTPYRKKEQRNPRVKHRNKFRKALIRRKGAVRTVRKETTRYGGEISGINASVKKSTKLK